jgi:hypothetical protein
MTIRNCGLTFFRNKAFLATRCVRWLGGHDTHVSSHTPGSRNAPKPEKDFLAVPAVSAVSSGRRPRYVTSTCRAQFPLVLERSGWYRAAHVVSHASIRPLGPVDCAHRSGRRPDRGRDRPEVVRAVLPMWLHRLRVDAFEDANYPHPRARDTRGCLPSPPPRNRIEALPVGAAARLAAPARSKLGCPWAGLTCSASPSFAPVSFCSPRRFWSRRRRDSDRRRRSVRSPSVLRAPKLAVLETAEERLRIAQAGTVGADVERARRYLQHLAVVGHRRRVVLDVLGADERLRGARCQRRLRRRGDCRGRKNIILCVLSDLCGCF